MENNVISEKYWHTERGFISPGVEDPITLKDKLKVFWWILTRIFKSPYQLGVDFPVTHALQRKEALSLQEKYSVTPSVTWLGHASFVFKIGNINILTDPILFGTPGSFFVRSLKRLPCPFSVSDLENIDLLLISHEHYDHLHIPSLKSLLNPHNIQPIVPIGVGSKLKKIKFRQPIEVDWFENYKSQNIKITAVPAIHYSDFKKRNLWSGYVISATNKNGKEVKIYFSGDSGYGSFIKKNIAPFGPFDAICIGVGGHHLNFTSRAPLVHTSPEQAVQTAHDVGAKRIIGMHWGTIRTSDEDQSNLRAQMAKHAKNIGYNGDVCLLRIGETIPI